MIFVLWTERCLGNFLTIRRVFGVSTSTHISKLLVGIRADSLEKTLMLGKIDNKRRRGQQRVKWLDSITDSMDMNLRKFWETVEDRGA